MSLINLIIILIVVGVLLWLVNTYIPMDRKIKNILNIVVVIGVVIWLLQVFGVLGSLDNIRIGNWPVAGILPLTAIGILCSLAYGRPPAFTACW